MQKSKLINSAFVHGRVPSLMSSCQELALAGCSNICRRPCSACASHIPVPQAAWIIAFFIFLAIYSGSCLLWCNPCNEPRALHIGEVMCINGLISSWSSSVFFLAAGSRKSHRLPFSSLMSISKEYPGRQTCQAVACTVLGGEYSSLTFAFVRQAVGSSVLRVRSWFRCTVIISLPIS